MDRRLLLLGSQFVQMTCAFLLAALIAFGVIEVWHILTLSFVVGLAQAFGGPAYQALIPSLVDSEDLANAIALNSIQFNLARVIGPVLGGLALTGLGAAWCFALNGASFVAVIVSLLLLKISFVPRWTDASMLASMQEGIRFVRKQGAMEALIVLAFLMTALGVPMITFLPVFAKDIFQGGPSTFTLLLSVSGVGSVAGALLVAALGNLRRMGRVMLLFLIVLGVATSGFALSRSLLLSCVLVFVTGAAMIAVFAMVSSLVQLITSNELRGRVMSVYNVAFRGGMPIGNLATGWLVPWLTAPVVLAVNGLAMVGLGAYFLVIQRRVAAL
jgi:predicted MFS family arabinose efflux permease